MKTIEEMRARLAEIVAKLGEFKALATFTDEDLTSINELNNESVELKRNIEAKQALENIENISSTPAPKVTKPAAVNKPKEVTGNGFETVGSFYKAVAMARGGNVDKRLTLQNTANERYGEDGGFLIPADFRSEIQSVIEGDSSLISKTRQFKTSSNHLVLPVSETAPWDGSGIQAFWEGESEQYTGSKPKFRQANLRLNKLTALVRVSEELLEDAPALESFIKMETPKVFTHKINCAIIDGDGNGKPKGFLRSPFKVKVAKESGQDADTVLSENVINMYSRMLPESIARAEWLINPQVMPQIRLMKFDASADSPVPMFIPPSGLDAAPYGTLLGRPIRMMMGGVKALGDEGDISFVDLEHYISAVKTSGVKSQVSTHVYFDRDETAFKFSLRVAGEVPYIKPVTTEHGDFDMSGVVTLADR